MEIPKSRNAPQDEIKERLNDTPTPPRHIESAGVFTRPGPVKPTPRIESAGVFTRPGPARSEK